MIRIPPNFVVTYLLLYLNPYFIAPVGHSFMQSPQWIHSLSQTFFMSILHFLTHLSHPIHLLWSTFIPKKLMGLKREYIAPSGQINLQNPLYANIQKIRQHASINIFQENKNPSIPLTLSSAMARGIPPSSVPAGQMNLQKAGYPFIMGITITRAIRITYFIYERILVTLLFFSFGTGILWISSCKNPKGHKKPQINLPRKSPNNKRVPTT